MSIANLCSREVVVVGRDTTAEQAAQLMRQNHVGDLVIVDEVDGKAKPAGIVTDRDIVLSVVATGLDPKVFTVGDLVFEKLVTCPQSTGFYEAIQLMRMHGIRRIPVVDEEESLVGILTVDDIVQLMAEEMAELGKLITKEQAHEAEARK